MSEKQNPYRSSATTAKSDTLDDEGPLTVAWVVRFLVSLIATFGVPLLVFKAIVLITPTISLSWPQHIDRIYIPIGWIGLVSVMGVALFGFCWRRGHRQLAIFGAFFWSVPLVLFVLEVLRVRFK